MVFKFSFRWKTPKPALDESHQSCLLPTSAGFWVYFVFGVWSVGLIHWQSCRFFLCQDVHLKCLLPLSSQGILGKVRAKQSWHLHFAFAATSGSQAEPVYPSFRLRHNSGQSLLAALPMLVPVSKCSLEQSPAPWSSLDQLPKGIQLVMPNTKTESAWPDRPPMAVGLQQAANLKCHPWIYPLVTTRQNTLKLRIAFLKCFMIVITLEGSPRLPLFPCKQDKLQINCELHSLLELKNPTLFH